MTLKEKIFQESLRLFPTKGFPGTSISEILEAAEASIGGLYNHFRTKEELFSDLFRESRKIWREKNLAGLDEIEERLGKVERLL